MFILAESAPFSMPKIHKRSGQIPIKLLYYTKKADTMEVTTRVNTSTSPTMEMMRFFLLDIFHISIVLFS